MPRGNVHRKHPLIPGWSPLEEADRALYPTIPPERQTREQREAVIAYAKELYAQRTGHRIA